jgi:hypothetical protein
MSDQSEKLLDRERITPVSLPPFKAQLNPATAISPVGIAPSIETPSDTAASLNNSVSGDWLQPPNDKVKDTRVVYHGGAIASGVAIVLIYWGDAWTYPVNTPLLYEFDGAARNLVSGPFPSALRQYGVERPWVKESIQITKPWPPTTFDESDINKIVFALIENGRYPEPDEDGGQIFYCVIMPPGTIYGPGGLSGAHTFPSSGSIIDTDIAWLGWVGAADLNTMTRTFGHELVETCTDPEGDGWYVDSLGSQKGEIGDLCNSRQWSVNGVWAEYYWSNADNACVFPSPDIPPTFGQGGPTREQMAMEEFRQRAKIAAQQHFVGGFPNFYYATYGYDHVGGTIFIKSTTAEWRDVPLADLENVSLEDFAGRMRATNAYASRNGFVGGFPNYFHADYGRGIVCGTVLITLLGAEWRDVPLSELGNPTLDDFEARFRATQDYAIRNGFVGGFPNLFHADYGRGIVCGTVLLRPGFAEWQDVLLFRDPA